MPKLNISPVSGSILGWAEKAFTVPPNVSMPRVSSVTGSSAKGGPPSHSDSSRSPCMTTEVLETLAGWRKAFPSMPCGRCLPKPRLTMWPGRRVRPALSLAAAAPLDWLAAYAYAGGHLVLGPRTGYADHEARARHEPAP